MKHGSFYRRRDGVEVCLTKYHSGLDYCWEAETGDRYNDLGRYYYQVDHAKDIMEEIPYSTVTASSSPNT